MAEYEILKEEYEKAQTEFEAITNEAVKEMKSVSTLDCSVFIDNVIAA